jgi:3-phosphoglycerate kinase
MNKKTIRDVDLKGKKVLMRVDFNVPLDDKLNITDITRISAALPTIKYALDKQAKVILMSHLGRPDGKVVENMRLNPVAKKLEELLGRKVTKLNDCIGAEVKTTVSQMKPGEVILLENLRFHAEEEKNDPDFAKDLASLGEIFVNDAFGTAHRAHASTEGVCHYLPSVAGFLMEKEIDYLGRVLASPAKPFIAILGGAKVSDKIGVVENLLDKVQTILIGGGMAYTFLKVLGKPVGNSKVEKDKLNLAEEILKKSQAKGVKIVLPVDNLIADKYDISANTKLVDENIPDGWMALDIGPLTIESFKKELKNAKTILWNGPLGVFEMEKFKKGTAEIANFISTLKATTVIGGGDTASAIVNLGLQSKMSHVSTGGGASLEFLEGKSLPGVAALADKDKVSSCQK